jgi:hypothetical protein
VDSPLLLLLVPLLVPLLWGLLRLVTPSVAYDLDFDTGHGTFLMLYQQYARCLWAIFWTGLLGAVADQGAVGHGDAPAVLLGSAVHALVTNLWLLLSYERYLQGRYPRDGSLGPSNYTANRYALTLALAAGTVGLFVTGLALALRGLR